MVRPLREEFFRLLNVRLSRVLRAAEIGIPQPHQFEAFRTFTLDEFGNQGLLPELDALLMQYERARNGQAETAGKGVPR